MKKIRKTLKIRRREITLVLVSSMVLLLFFSGYSMGKGYSGTSIKVKGEIAEPILIVENNPVIEMNGKKQKEYYEFKVKNHNEKGQITQVELQYNIEIISPIEEAISFKLYKEKKEIPLKNNKTPNMNLTKEKEQEDQYQLEIIYDTTKNSSIEEIIQDVQIKVHSEQLKV